MKNYGDLALKMHEDNKGKIEIKSKIKLQTKEDLAIAYTPGVAKPCEEIYKDIDNVYKYTSKGNTIAIVSDGSAVLGLGNIGASASIPVMEGKSILFKEFANVNAVPICLNTQNVDEIVNIIKCMEPTFGGINLEDIASPRCFEIEKRLKEELDIPIFHDDQHGTAIVVAAGVINSLKLAQKDIKDVNVVLNGPGAAGIAISKLLINLGVKNIVLCDKDGILNENSKNLNWAQKEMLSITNKNKEIGTLKDAVVGKDIFIGVSAANVLDESMIKSMNDKAIVFAMANPVPEIMPDVAKNAGAFIVGTGRSDFSNQVNNVLAFPGIFKGALEIRACDINEQMKISAAIAIAECISDENLNVDNILPSIFDENVTNRVANAVKNAAIKSMLAKV